MRARAQPAVLSVVVVAVLAVALVAACGSDSGSVPAALGTAGAGGIEPLGVEVLETRPHRADAFTQGLLLDDGRLFESTGLEGRSSLREVDPDTGEVLRSVAVDDELFAEGLALVDDRLIQLTWQDGIALVYDVDTFEELDRLTYDGEGWGLCTDGDRMVMSDGSSTLTFRDPHTFAVLGSVEVEAAGEPVTRLNELECVDGAVWANVWQTDLIVRIDPDTGAVTGRVDATGLLDQDPAPGVLNGIAWDPDEEVFLLTGKNWPTLFVARLEPTASDDAAD